MANAVLPFGRVRSEWAGPRVGSPGPQVDYRVVWTFVCFEKLSYNKDAGRQGARLA